MPNVTDDIPVPPRARQPEGIVFCDPVHIIRIDPATNGRTKPGRLSKH